MTKRERWVTELTASRHVHRFLTRIGAASDPAIAPAISAEELKSYLGSLRGGAADARILLEVLELLTYGYDSFIQETLPDLLSVLGSRMEFVQEVVGPGLRGNVRWDLTKVSRANRTLPATRYVSNVPRRTYDTPENLLLCWLLADLDRAIGHIGKRIGSARLHTRLRAIREGCRTALRNEALSGVESIRSVSQQMIHAAMHSRHEGYRKAAALTLRRRRMQERSKIAQWMLALELLRTNWLEPVSDNDLFEIFALSTTLSVLSEEIGLGAPAHYGLLGSALEPAATFKNGGSTVRVYFNRTPNRMLGASGRYLSVLGVYSGIGGYDRRPDIIIQVECAAKGTRTFIVEVKNAEAQSYVRESIYKVFGYLYDYEGLFGEQNGCKAALYVPDGTVQFLGQEEADSGIVIVVEGDRGRLAKALREGLSL